MIYKNTSVKRVIAKVFTDFDLKEGDHRISDMIEWASEALEKISAFPYFELKVTGKNDNPLIELNDYQAKLPSDFHKLTQVAYSSNKNGPYYPMRSTTGTMDIGFNNSNSSGTVTSTTVLEDNVIILAMSIYGLTYSEALIKINSEPSTRSLLTSLLSEGDVDYSGEYIDGNTDDLIYMIRGNYIKTNIRSGYLKIAYQAIPTDIDGYPLVPDDVSFMEALYWYIAMKLLYPMWRDGRVRDAVYYDAKRSWNYYSKQAYGNALMPNIDQLESFKNSWLRLVPELGEHSTGFTNLGKRQVIYNAN